MPSKSRQQSRQNVQLPTLQQRERVLELLATLSPRYTKECTRNSQPLYSQQALDRYGSLIGHNTPKGGSWISGLLGYAEEDHMQVVRRDLTSDGHKYFFAINLYNSFDVIPDLFATLFRVSAILGYHNVFPHVGAQSMINLHGKQVFPLVSHVARRMNLSIANTIIGYRYIRRC